MKADCCGCDGKCLPLQQERLFIVQGGWLCVVVALENIGQYAMIKDFDLKLKPQDGFDEGAISRYLIREEGFSKDELRAVRVIRRSIDARRRKVMYTLTVRAFINEEPQETAYEPTLYKDVSGKSQAVVVGAGPAGLFAALRLIEKGVRPVIIERGKNVRDRKKDLAKISREQSVDPESNYCFGEGGAGAYSDGKLFTRSRKRGDVRKILNVFCQHGASTSILADAHPHIGTDRLPRVIENMRKTIISCGGEVHFQTRMTSLIVENHTVKGVSAITAQGDEIQFMGPVILATGHSARDVYRYLNDAKVAIEAKGLAVGVRLEHPSHLIDEIQYHSKQGRGKYLPAAEYSFVTQVDGRGVYSFCMCPGGFVIPSATGPQQMVTNGMSPSSRGTRWSNSGMVVQVEPSDLASKGKMGPLAMLELQEELEQMAWQQGGRKQTAPAQRMADFVSGRLSSTLPTSSYAPGLVASPLHFWMPDFVSDRLRKAFEKFGKQARGFLTNEATVIAIETRTSAPVRILRDRETLQHIEISGLFPCGEGAGYAGGIVSAGVDGERCADSVTLYLNS